jgi:N-acetylmuramoyl-L-alanine amidase
VREYQGVEWSPNKSARPEGVPIDTIVLHATVGKFDGAIAWCMSPQSKVSYHYIISKTGEVRQLVPLHRQAWHAGVCRMTIGGKTVQNVNARSIGIALENRNDGVDPYPDDQVGALINLIEQLKGQVRSLRYLVSHAEVAYPRGRKSDPKGLNLAPIRARTGLRGQGECY